jgi:outer membrane protein assembly factor BamE (lipoprotein component of BamABCDE complex)
MTRSSLSLACGFAFVASLSSSLAVANTLTGPAANGPKRGMTMSQVEKHFGAPTNKLTPAGGDAPLHPVINRWVYADYTVYFERDRVIDSVANHTPAAAQ